MAVIHNRHTIAEPLSLVHVVRGENDGASGLLELVHHVPQMAARLRVESGRGLVEKQQLRIANQGAGHGQPLLLPAGKAAYAGMALFFKLRGANRLVDRDAVAKETAKKPERLLDGKFVRELGFLELNTDALAKFAGPCGPVQAEHFHRPFVGIGEAFADFNGGGLPCPIGAEQAKALTLHDFEIEPIDSLHVGKGFLQAPQQQARPGESPLS